VDATVHRGATRTNIPTAELESFAEDDEKKPTMLLFARDPSLDPQLVWKGKDEQDRADLNVLAVPIYIQEKIHPRVLVEELQAESNREESQHQIDFFGDFNGLEFAKLVEFYQHPMKWQNRMILGDSLLVMASLAEKEGLRGKVQLVYMDPPYGIRFGSNWQVSTRKRDVRDGKGEDATRQPEQIKAFRDTWQLGIHSYLAYLRDRLVVARNLLTETGSAFVQIGDDNVHLVRSLLDETFGSENFVSCIAFKKTSGAGSFAGGTNVLASVTDYLLWYARDISQVKYRQLYRQKTAGGAGGGAYGFVEDPDGSRRRASEIELDTGQSDGRFFRADNLTSQTTREAQTTVFPVELDGRSFVPGRGGWKTNVAGMNRLKAARRLIALGNTLSYVRFIDDFPAFQLTNLWDDTTTAGFGDPKVYVVQTNAKVVERCILMATDPGDLILDPTCGSGTTAVVAEEWGRRWITADTSRVALALARTRLMTARYPYYLLADSGTGIAREAELAGRLPDSTVAPSNDVSKGFVYERVPHLTLKSIANNQDIQDGMSRGEINAAIARHAETEALCDRPYIEPRTVRVTGPFTVESLSPHRVIDADSNDGTTGVVSDPAPFIDRIIENLRKAGVQNTVKGERLNFDRLDRWPGGVYVHAAGEYSEGGARKTVALCIGPEYGTVGVELVREAAKEAVKFADLLVVCGFAFESHVGDEASKLGRLTILKARMNPDLSMGDELLKKTGAANLFMVFGEPDITVEATDGDKLTIEIRGVDTYNPTTGEIRSDSTEEIACWFLDTEYNGESFFVRHAYFLGADDPYDKLKRALRADIDEAAWSTMHRAKSRPFPKPATGKIAIKVINHYGDEVLKVYPV
jgi:adenine-specific DNA-methyltransferase